MATLKEKLAAQKALQKNPIEAVKKFPHDAITGGLKGLYSESIALAKDENTPLGILDFLKGNVEVEVRRMVANNSKSSKEILEYLSKDKIREVVCAVATNPNTPWETLEKLSRSVDEFVRESVATNQNTPDTTLIAMVLDEDIDVKVALASNMNTPEEALTALSNKDIEGVNYALLDNPNVTDLVLKRIQETSTDGDIIKNAKDKRIQNKFPHAFEGLYFLWKKGIEYDIHITDLLYGFDDDSVPENHPFYGQPMYTIEFWSKENSKEDFETIHLYTDMNPDISVLVSEATDAFLDYGNKKEEVIEHKPTVPSKDEIVSAITKPKM